MSSIGSLIRVDPVIPSNLAVFGGFSNKTCRGVKAKIRKFENFFIYFSIRTCGENAAYNYVEFRSNRACCSNYRGASFAREQEDAGQKGEYRIQETEYRRV